MKYGSKLKLSNIVELLVFALSDIISVATSTFYGTCLHGYCVIVVRVFALSQVVCEGGGSVQSV